MDLHIANKNYSSRSMRPWVLMKTLGLSFEESLNPFPRDVKTFENCVVAVPASIDPAKYTAVIVWCESFGQFITAAKYR